MLASDKVNFVEDDKVFIDKVVDSFYDKAIKDVFIGHHFRKIAQGNSASPISSELGQFERHLPRIKAFWYFILLGQAPAKDEPKFNLVKSHDYLNIRRGELGRWHTLFFQTLEELNQDNNNNSLVTKWKLEVEKIKTIFEKKYFKV